MPLTIIWFSVAPTVNAVVFVTGAPRPNPLTTLIVESTLIPLNNWLGVTFVVIPPETNGNKSDAGTTVITTGKLLIDTEGIVYPLY